CPALRCAGSARHNKHIYVLRWTIAGRGLSVKQTRLHTNPHPAPLTSRGPCPTVTPLCITSPRPAIQPAARKETSHVTTDASAQLSAGVGGRNSRPEPGAPCQSSRPGGSPRCGGRPVGH